MDSLNSWSRLFKSGTLEVIDSECKTLSEKLLQPKSELMRLNVKFNEASSYYRVMRELSEPSNSPSASTNQSITSSLISFLTIDNFPDAIFLEIDSTNTPIFHIIELKRYPPNHFENLSRQFLSAYLHCKSLSSLLHFESESQYKYYVVYNEVVVEEKLKSKSVNNQYNKNNPPRTLVGSPTPQKITKWFNDRKIDFFESNHTYEFCNIINIPLKFHNSLNETDEFFSEIQV